jgi:hypothetical protein
MDKHVFAAIVRLNKPKAFLGIEKFHCSDSHRRFLFWWGGVFGRKDGKDFAGA